MALTKAIIVEKISAQVDCGINHPTAIVESLIEIIKSTLESGEDLLISGFGKFCIKDRTAHIGRNPATGETTTLPARRVVTFQCSKNLRERLNRKRRRLKKPKL